MHIASKILKKKTYTTTTESPKNIKVAIRNKIKSKLSIVNKSLLSIKMKSKNSFTTLSSTTTSLDTTTSSDDTTASDTTVSSDTTTESITTTSKRICRQFSQLRLFFCSALVHGYQCSRSTSHHRTDNYLHNFIQET